MGVRLPCVGSARSELVPSSKLQALFFRAAAWMNQAHNSKEHPSSQPLSHARLGSATLVRQDKRPLWSSIGEEAGIPEAFVSQCSA